MVHSGLRRQFGLGAFGPFTQGKAENVVNIALNYALLEPFIHFAKASLASFVMET